MAPKNIAVVCGGYSGEKVVSMRSAAMVMNNIDRSKYTPHKVVIMEDRWYVESDGLTFDLDKNDFSYQSNGKKVTFDGVFMIIHGTPGENGLLQGYFEILGIPTTTGDTLCMSLTFNKKMTTRVLGGMDYNVAKSIELKSTDSYSETDIIATVGVPCFVKPNCGGSSIGTSRVNHQNELRSAIEKAFKEDSTVIIEEYIQGTEVTCGVITLNGKITALPVTEIVSQSSFFDFEAKYEGKSEEITPARIDKHITHQVQAAAVGVYQKLNCKGMIRVDFIIQDNQPFLIEVNTTPGFSEASIIPQQAAVHGLSKSELISAVIESCF